MDLKLDNVTKMAIGVEPHLSVPVSYAQQTTEYSTFNANVVVILHLNLPNVLKF